MKLIEFTLHETPREVEAVASAVCEVFGMTQAALLSRISNRDRIRCTKEQFADYIRLRVELVKVCRMSNLNIQEVAHSAAYKGKGIVDMRPNPQHEGLIVSVHQDKPNYGRGGLYRTSVDQMVKELQRITKYEWKNNGEFKRIHQTMCDGMETRFILRHIDLWHWHFNVRQFSPYFRVSTVKIGPAEEPTYDYDAT